MSYYFEIWLKGFANDQLKSMSDRDDDSYHPHITLVRPFEIRRQLSEQTIQQRVVDYCKIQKTPIPFSLQGTASFDGQTHYIPVTNLRKLLEFDAGLELLLQTSVEFRPKLHSHKLLHATINSNQPTPYCKRLEEYMLRLTGIHNKRIWFQYDFVTGRVLTREEALDKDLWQETVTKFNSQRDLK